MTELAASLIDPIREGSFPESPDLLTSDVTTEAVPKLLEAITAARDELSNELRSVSRPYAGGVDEWISQAKKAQQDIARCKQDASDIIQEHKRLEQLRQETDDANSKATLLSDEIAFTKELQNQLHGIGSAHERLRLIEADLQQGHAVQAAQALKDVRDAVLVLKGPRVRSIVSDYRDDLISKTRAHLSETLLSRFVDERHDGQRTLRINNTPECSNDEVFSALSDLDAIEPLVSTVVERLNGVASDAVSTKSSHVLKSCAIQDNVFTLLFTENDTTSVSLLLKFTSDFAAFLRAHLPPQMYSILAGHIGPRLISALVGDWLTPAIPINLDDLPELDQLKQEVLALAQSLDDNQWPRTEDLRQWTKHAPRMWIAKRKAEALETVRRAFQSSVGSLHQVERIERQKASSLDAPLETSSVGPDAENDWNTSWEEDEKPGSNSAHQDDGEVDASGWGFDDDMDGDTEKTHTGANGRAEKEDFNKDEDEDVDDAWGWGEDTADLPSKAVPQQADQAARSVNGLNDKAPASQELVLTELYSITDIPDRLIEGIGRDIQDALRLSEEDHASLRDVPASSGLLALPSLSLAMFRATALIYYSKNSTLGNMNLYNDALYVADKLRGMTVPSGMKDVDADCAAMEKFARSAYAREMETQRTILGDLLDGVQGFTIPYAEQIEEAISATSDRLRQVHHDWSPILSTSALLQSVGALYSSILSSVITDIEEMDDISEAQSQRLSNFCTQLGKLEDLFRAQPPEGAGHQEEAVSMVAVYTSNWLRFQYLDQILSASLVDIKYLWTEGELSLEFSADEVVDLIRALFAESSHRRSAIAAIKGHRGSGMS